MRRRAARAPASKCARSRLLRKAVIPSVTASGSRSAISLAAASASACVEMRVRSKPRTAGDGVAVHVGDDRNRVAAAYCEEPVMERSEYGRIARERFSQVHARAKRRAFGIQEDRAGVARVRRVHGFVDTLA